MKTSKFGPIAWKVLQSTPYLLGSNISTLESRESINIFIVGLAHVLPCRYCRESFIKYIRCIDAYKWIQRPVDLQVETVEYYIYLLHNLVNQKLDKAWYKDKKQVYRKVSLEEYIQAVFDWMLIVYMNIDFDPKKFQSVSQPASRFVKKYTQKGKMLREANEKKIPLIDYIESAIDQCYIDEHVKDKGINTEEWQKFIWYMLYTLHMGRIFKTIVPSSGAGALLCECALSGETFLTQDKAQQELYKARQQCEKTCQPLARILESFANIRAT